MLTSAGQRQAGDTDYSLEEVIQVESAHQLVACKLRDIYEDAHEAKILALARREVEENTLARSQ